MQFTEYFLKHKLIDSFSASCFILLHFLPLFLFVWLSDDFFPAPRHPLLPSVYLLCIAFTLQYFGFVCLSMKHFFPHPHDPITCWSNASLTLNFPPVKNLLFSYEASVWHPHRALSDIILPFNYCSFIHLLHSGILKLSSSANRATQFSPRPPSMSVHAVLMNTTSQKCLQWWPKNPSIHPCSHPWSGWSWSWCALYLYLIHTEWWTQISVFLYMFVRSGVKFFNKNICTVSLFGRRYCMQDVI